MWQISSHAIIKQMHNSSRRDPPYRNTRQKQHTITSRYRISFDHNFPEPREGVDRQFSTGGAILLLPALCQNEFLSVWPCVQFSPNQWDLFHVPTAYEGLFEMGSFCLWILTVSSGCCSFSSMHVTFDNATFSWLFQSYYEIVPTIKRSFPTHNTQNGSKERLF